MMAQKAYEYIDAIRLWRERLQSENRLEEEICNAVLFLLEREQERELAREYMERERDVD